MEKKRLTAFALVRRIGERRERIGQFPLSPMEGRSAEDRKRNALAMARRQWQQRKRSAGARGPIPRCRTRITKK